MLSQASKARSTLTCAPSTNAGAGFVIALQGLGRDSGPRRTQQQAVPLPHTLTRRQSYQRPGLLKTESHRRSVGLLELAGTLGGAPLVAAAAWGGRNGAGAWPGGTPRLKGRGAAVWKPGAAGAPPRAGGEPYGRCWACGGCWVAGGACAAGGAAASGAGPPACPEGWLMMPTERAMTWRGRSGAQDCGCYRKKLPSRPALLMPMPRPAAAGHLELAALLPRRAAGPLVLQRGMQPGGGRQSGSLLVHCRHTAVVCHRAWSAPFPTAPTRLAQRAVHHDAGAPARRACDLLRQRAVHLHRHPAARRSVRPAGAGSANAAGLPVKRPLHRSEQPSGRAWPLHRTWVPFASQALDPRQSPLRPRIGAPHPRKPCGSPRA
jgi:hypothetical protein